MSSAGPSCPGGPAGVAAGSEAAASVEEVAEGVAVGSDATSSSGASQAGNGDEASPPFPVVSQPEVVSPLPPERAREGMTPERRRDLLEMLATSLR